MFLSHSLASLADIMLLNREDLVEMGLPIGVRNQLMEVIQRNKAKPEESGIKVMELMMNSIVQISNGQRGEKRQDH